MTENPAPVENNKIFISPKTIDHAFALKNRISSLKPTELFGAKLDARGEIKPKRFKEITELTKDGRKDKTNLVEYVKEDAQIGSMLQEILRLGLTSEKELNDLGLFPQQYTSGEKSKLQLYKMSHEQKAEAITLILEKFSGDNLSKGARREYYQRVFNDVILKGVNHIDSKGGNSAPFPAEDVMTALMIGGTEEIDAYYLGDSYRPFDSWPQEGEKGDKSRRQVKQYVNIGESPNYTQEQRGKTAAVKTAGKYKGLAEKLREDGFSEDEIKQAVKKVEIPESVQTDLRVAQAMFNIFLPPEDLVEMTRLQLQINKTADPMEKEHLNHELTMRHREAYATVLMALDAEGYQIGGKYLQDIFPGTTQREVVAKAEKMKSGIMKRFKDLSLLDANRESLSQFATHLLKLNPDGEKHVQEVIKGLDFSPKKYAELESQFAGKGFSKQFIEDKVRAALFDELWTAIKPKTVTKEAKTFLQEFFNDRYTTELALKERKGIKEGHEKGKSFSDLEDPNRVKVIGPERWGIKGLDLLFRRTLPSDREQETYDDYIRRLQERLKNLSQEPPPAPPSTPPTGTAAAEIKLDLPDLPKTPIQYKSAEEAEVEIGPKGIIVKSKGHILNILPNELKGNTLEEKINSALNNPQLKPDEKKALSELKSGLVVNELKPELKKLGLTDQEITNEIELKGNGCQINHLTLSLTEEKKTELENLQKTLKQKGIEFNIGNLTLDIPKDNPATSIDLQNHTLESLQITGDSTKKVEIQHARAKSINVGKNIQATMQPVDLQRVPLAELQLQDNAVVSINEAILDNLRTIDSKIILGKDAVIEVLRTGKPSEKLIGEAGEYKIKKATDGSLSLEKVEATAQVPSTAEAPVRVKSASLERKPRENLPPNDPLRASSQDRHFTYNNWALLVDGAGGTGEAGARAAEFMKNGMYQWLQGNGLNVKSLTANKIITLPPTGKAITLQGHTEENMKKFLTAASKNMKRLSDGTGGAACLALAEICQDDQGRLCLPYLVSGDVDIVIRKKNGTIIVTENQSERLANDKFPPDMLTQNYVNTRYAVVEYIESGTPTIDLKKSISTGIHYLDEGDQVMIFSDGVGDDLQNIRGTADAKGVYPQKGADGLTIAYDVLNEIPFDTPVNERPKAILDLLDKARALGKTSPVYSIPAYGRMTHIVNINGKNLAVGPKIDDGETVICMEAHLSKQTPPSKEVSLGSESIDTQIVEALKQNGSFFIEKKQKAGELFNKEGEELFSKVVNDFLIVTGLVPTKGTGVCSDLVPNKESFHTTLAAPLDDSTIQLGFEIQGGKMKVIDAELGMNGPKRPEAIAIKNKVMDPKNDFHELIINHLNHKLQGTGLEIETVFFKIDTNYFSLKVSTKKSAKPPAPAPAPATPTPTTSTASTVKPPAVHSSPTEAADQFKLPERFAKLGLTSEQYKIYTQYYYLSELQSEINSQLLKSKGFVDDEIKKRLSREIETRIKTLTSNKDYFADNKGSTFLKIKGQEVGQRDVTFAFLEEHKTINYSDIDSLRWLHHIPSEKRSEITQTVSKITVDSFKSLDEGTKFQLSSVILFYSDNQDLIKQTVNFLDENFKGIQKPPTISTAASAKPPIATTVSATTSRVETPPSPEQVLQTVESIIKNIAEESRKGMTNPPAEELRVICSAYGIEPQVIEQQSKNILDNKNAKLWHEQQWRGGKASIATTQEAIEKEVLDDTLRYYGAVFVEQHLAKNGSEEIKSWINDLLARENAKKTEDWEKTYTILEEIRTNPQTKPLVDDLIRRFSETYQQTQEPSEPKKKIKSVTTVKSKVVTQPPTFSPSYNPTPKRSQPQPPTFSPNYNPRQRNPSAQPPIFTENYQPQPRTRTAESVVTLPKKELSEQEEPREVLSDRIFRRAVSETPQKRSTRFQEILDELAAKTIKSPVDQYQTDLNRLRSRINRQPDLAFIKTPSVSPSPPEPSTVAESTQTAKKSRTKFVYRASDDKLKRVRPRQKPIPQPKPAPTVAVEPIEAAAAVPTPAIEVESDIEHFSSPEWKAVFPYLEELSPWNEDESRIDKNRAIQQDFFNSFQEVGSRTQKLFNESKIRISELKQTAQLDEFKAEIDNFDKLAKEIKPSELLELCKTFINTSENATSGNVEEFTERLKRVRMDEENKVNDPPARFLDSWFRVSALHKTLSTKKIPDPLLETQFKRLENHPLIALRPQTTPQPEAPIEAEMKLVVEPPTETKQKEAKIVSSSLQERLDQASAILNVPKAARPEALQTFLKSMPVEDQLALIGLVKRSGSETLKGLVTQYEQKHPELESAKIKFLSTPEPVQSGQVKETDVAETSLTAEARRARDELAVLLTKQEELRRLQLSAPKALTEEDFAKEKAEKIKKYEELKQKRKSEFISSGDFEDKTVELSLLGDNEGNFWEIAPHSGTWVVFDKNKLQWFDEKAWLARRKELSVEAPARESIIPAEVEPMNSDQYINNTESSVRKLVVEGKDGKEINLYYKRPLEGAQYDNLSKKQESLTPDQAFELAKQKQNEYQNNQVCFGENHVAQTLYTIGKDVTYQKPQVHMYQEAIEETLYNALGIAKAIPNDTPGVKKVLVEKLGTIKQKGLFQLNPNDPVEATIMAGLKEHREALRDFYPSYVESILLGYVPDIQFIDNSAEIDLGLIFSQNLGIKKDASGQEIIKIIDFGESRVDIFPFESRQRLRNLIEEHKAHGELPIHEITEQSHIGKYEISKHTRRDLADWYKEALMNELKPTKNKEEVDKVLWQITRMLNLSTAANEPQKNEYFIDLDAFRRLCEASSYETPVLIDYDQTPGSEKTTTKIGNNEPVVVIKEPPTKPVQPIEPEPVVSESVESTTTPTAVSTPEETLVKESAIPLEQRFKVAEGKFRELQKKIQKGDPVSREDYEAQVADFSSVTDNDGNLWEINPRTGKWMMLSVKDGWKLADPPYKIVESQQSAAVASQVDKKVPSALDDDVGRLMEELLRRSESPSRLGSDEELNPIDDIIKRYRDKRSTPDEFHSGLANETVRKITYDKISLTPEQRTLLKDVLEKEYFGNELFNKPETAMPPEELVQIMTKIIDKWPNIVKAKQIAKAKASFTSNRAQKELANERTRIEKSPFYVELFDFLAESVRGEATADFINEWTHKMYVLFADEITEKEIPDIAAMKPGELLADQLGIQLLEEVLASKK